MRIKEFTEKVQRGEINPNEHIIKAIEETKKINREYNYLNIICDERAVESVKTCKGILQGVPTTVKDSIVVKGVESTAGSKILKGYIPEFNSTCVQKGEDEGAIVLGKTAQDEFGFGTFSTNVGIGFEIPKNPFDKDRACGGSSGGAAGFAQKATFPTVSYGESTGGSIVAPACFCGVYGLCPTYGRVSRYGLIDYGNSLDKVGPLSKYIEDVAISLGVMSGYDEKDSTSADVGNEDFTEYLKKDVKGMKIGVISDAFKDINKDVDGSVWEGIKLLESKGAEYEKVSTPLALEYGLAVYYIIATSEASTNLAKYCGMRYGKSEESNESFNEYFSNIRSKNFGEEVKRRIILGTFARMAGVRDAYYLKAAKIRTMIIEEYKKLFKKYDLLVSPVMPYQAPKLAEIEKLSPIQNYMADIMTVSPNLAGLPHLSIPLKQKNSLPMGMMAISDHFNEGKLIQAGKEFEDELHN